MEHIVSLIFNFVLYYVKDVFLKQNCIVFKKKITRIE